MSQEKVISILRKEMPYLKDKYGVERIMLYGSLRRANRRERAILMSLWTSEDSWF